MAREIHNAVAGRLRHPLLAGHGAPPCLEEESGVGGGALIYAARPSRGCLQGGRSEGPTIHSLLLPPAIHYFASSTQPRIHSFQDDTFCCGFPSQRRASINFARSKRNFSSRFQAFSVCLLAGNFWKMERIEERNLRGRGLS